MSRVRGFTLLEVMVALVIFALVSVALVKNATSSVRHAAIIQDRTIAWWLAENRMTNFRVQPRNEENFPSAGTIRESVSQSEVDWDLEIKIEETENEFVRRIEIAVFKDGREKPDARLVGFMGQY